MTTQSDKPARLLTVKEYAAETRENPKSVYRRIAKGTQPGVMRTGQTAHSGIRIKAPM